MLLPLLSFLAVQDPSGQLGAETVVVAPRSEAHEEQSPATVTVITGEELEKTGERSLPRAIGRASNVWIQETNLGGGAPVINGLIGNRILIVVDGVRLNDSTTRAGPNQSLNGIDPLTVERVEVVRGPASVLYGSDAVGGAILIWTKRRRPASEAERAWRGGLDTEYGSAANGGRLSGNVSYGGESIGWLTVATGQRYDDLVAGGGEVQEHTGYSGGAVFGSWEANLGEQRTLRLVGRRTSDFDVPRTDKLNAGFGQIVPTHEVYDFKLQDRWSTLLAYSDGDGGAVADRMEARLSLRRYTEERLKRKTAATTETFERDETDTVGLSVDWQRALGGNHLLTWGFDVDYDQVDSLREDEDLNTGVITPVPGAFAEDARYLSSGLFVQDQIFSLSPWVLTAGARFSYYDFTFENFPANGRGTENGSFGALTASLSGTRPVAEQTNLTATLASAFRAPNLDDLANNGTFAGGTEIANPDLDPEQSLTAHLAVDTRRETWGGFAGVFFTRIDDLIGRTLLDPGLPPPGDETYLRDNVGYANLWGIDAGYDQRIGAASSPWSWRALATWTYGTQFGENIDPNDPSVDEVPFRRIPPLYGVVAFRWEEPSRSALEWGELSLVWALDQNRLHPQDVSDPRIDPTGTDGWTVLDFDVGGPFWDPAGTGGSTWNAGVHNILDENYRVHASSFQAAGIALVFGLHLSL